MAPPVEIRSRQEIDLVKLGEIMRRVYEQDRYPVEGVENTDEILRTSASALSWVAHLAGQVIGQISLIPAFDDVKLCRVLAEQNGIETDGLAFISRLFIDPNYRKCGAGRTLVQTALSYAKSQESKVALEVMQKDKGAIRLYESMGARRLRDIEHVHSGGAREPASVYAFVGR